MMSTSFSDINNGINFLSRAKMCTFSQCEPDAVITGSASEQDSEYAMQVQSFWTSRSTRVGPSCASQNAFIIRLKKKLANIDLYACSSNSIVVF